MSKRVIPPSTELTPEKAGHRVTRVVGVGASAGGLEAIGEFLAAVPADSGLAIIVVQHQDPQRKGMLPELLQRHTSMPVREIHHMMAIEPDHVYVIPPNADLAFADGALALHQPVNSIGQRFSIDLFFRALSAELQQNAAGVILSGMGMGMDGTAGLRALRECGGVTFAQTPESARFDAMPRSAIEAGVADVVAAPGTMPARLLDIWADLPRQLERGRARRTALRELLDLLQGHTGYNFSDYKMNTVLRRIERRIKLQQSESMEAYVTLLRGCSLAEAPRKWCKDHAPIRPPDRYAQATACVAGQSDRTGNPERGAG